MTFMVPYSDKNDVLPLVNFHEDTIIHTKKFEMTTLKSWKVKNNNL